MNYVNYFEYEMLCKFSMQENQNQHFKTLDLFSIVIDVTHSNEDMMLVFRERSFTTFNMPEGTNNLFATHRNDWNVHVYSVTIIDILTHLLSFYR